MTSEPLELFYSYSHKDENLRKKLESHLASLVQEKLILPWNSSPCDWQHTPFGKLQAFDSGNFVSKKMLIEAGFEQ